MNSIDISRTSIRKAGVSDLDAMVDIWHAASVSAHDFIDAGYWDANRSAMRDLYLPQAENWVVEDAEGVAGFCSLVGDRLAAVFVRPDCQRCGLGGFLLAQAKSLRERIELSVYEENGPALEFYRKHGFVVARRGMDDGTGHPELLMEWKAPA
ncbi:GNAT family N-acetyltransferase [Pseudodesulfovibrio sp.]|uniref:GNAT family N-acetyltransferase n=1 Tax=unclassified Pseudodesulfovibrio TaxID=2661612 RepID=UPI003B003805